MKKFIFKHGGNIFDYSKRLNIAPTNIIDASASLVPFSTPKFLLKALYEEIKNENFKYYPEKNFQELKKTIGSFHNIDPEKIMPGNGASELITWIGNEASQYGTNCLPVPGFVDYERSLNCWEAKYIFNLLPKKWSNNSQPFPLMPNTEVLWITNPHNPTGQLWTRESLKKLLFNYKLIICDEAFLSITPEGEKESLISLVKDFDNLIVIRSLTKLFSIAGLRLGYIVANSKILEKISEKRDPWPLNSFAIKAGVTLLKDKEEYNAWTKKIHNWINIEKEWISSEISKINGLEVFNSSTNFFLIKGKYSMNPTIEYLATKGILIRGCSSFRSLSNKWARISIQKRIQNRKIVNEMKKSYK
ncbi:MAG: threonine-phosphate decarboxylase [Prochlorococcus sp. SP3034]|nr:threonine-phosphate decarboxylase [Prochlorococcus sp. SP3034]